MGSSGLRPNLLSEGMSLDILIDVDGISHCANLHFLITNDIMLLFTCILAICIWLVSVQILNEAFFRPHPIEIIPAEINQ